MRKSRATEERVLRGLSPPLSPKHPRQGVDVMSKNLYARFQTDKVLEENGVWVDFGDGLEVKVARFNSARSKEVRRRLEKPFKGVFRSGQDLPEDKSTDILVKQMAEAIILDWKGVLGPDGKVLEPTLENKIKVLTDLPDFREVIATAALESATFKTLEDEEAGKNSVKP